MTRFTSEQAVLPLGRELLLYQFDQNKFQRSAGNTCTIKILGGVVVCESISSGAPTSLVVRHVPVPLTCGVFDGTIITDPSLLEEELLTTHATVVSTAEGQVRTGVNCLYCVSEVLGRGCSREESTALLARL